MKCKKKEKRDIINVFNNNDCINCKYCLLDEKISIGRDNINIFYLENKCVFNNSHFLVADKRIKLLFKEMIIDSYKRTNNIFLFLEKWDNFSSYYNDFEALLNNEYSIYIVE